MNDFLNDRDRPKAKGLRMTLYVTIALSLLLDIQIPLSPVLVHFQIHNPHGWSAVVYCAEAISEIIIIVGATVFWYVMLYHCMTSSRRTVLSKALWGLLFVFGAWWGSQVFYLAAIRREPAK